MIQRRVSSGRRRGWWWRRLWSKKWKDSRDDELLGQKRVLHEKLWNTSLRCHRRLSHHQTQNQLQLTASWLFPGNIAFWHRSENHVEGNVRDKIRPKHGIVTLTDQCVVTVSRWKTDWRTSAVSWLQRSESNKLGTGRILSGGSAKSWKRSKEDWQTRRVPRFLWQIYSHSNNIFLRRNVQGLFWKHI